MQFAYPFQIRKDGDEFIVTFPDVPEALTSADTRNQAIHQAHDALIAALGGYMELRRDIPRPSSKKPRQYIAYLQPLEAAKLALYMAMKHGGISNLGLAKRLGIDEKAVRRMLDLDQATKIETIQEALDHIFHIQLVTGMQPIHSPAQQDSAMALA
jgi:antitoxin HicB